jgi:hypothetical protein
MAQSCHNYQTAAVESSNPCGAGAGRKDSILDFPARFLFKPRICDK